MKGVGEKILKLLLPGAPEFEKVGLEDGLPKLSLVDKGISARLKTLNGCGAVDGRSNLCPDCGGADGVVMSCLKTDGWGVKLSPRTERGVWCGLGLGKLKVCVG